MKVGNSISLGTKGLRYKLMIAFSLMSIIPLLIALYFIVNYAFQDIQNLLYPSLIILFTVWIAFLGFILIRRIINPVIDLAGKTKDIAGGEFDSEVLVESTDELGDIAEAVGTMRDKMRGYVLELQKYGRRTASLNLQIHKKVLTLTNLMQLGDLITAGAKLNEILSFAAEKLACEMENSYSGIFMKEKEGNYTSKCFVNNSGKEILIREILLRMPFVEQVFNEGEPYIVLDSRPLTKHWQIDLRKKLELLNVLLVPMRSSGKIVGVMMLGNFASGFEFRDKDIQAIQAFEKVLVIGYQASQVYAVKTDEVIDNLTGLFTRSYLENRLDDEINRAAFYQRACSLVVLGIDDFDNYAKTYGEGKAEQILRQVARLISGSVSPVAKAARFGYSQFGVILPEKNKRESIMIAEGIRRQIEIMQISDNPEDRITISAGVGENPLDGAKAKEIIDKAAQNMNKAIEQGKNKVVGD